MAKKQGLGNRFQDAKSKKDFVAGDSSQAQPAAEKKAPKDPKLAAAPKQEAKTRGRKKTETGEIHKLVVDVPKELYEKFRLVSSTNGDKVKDIIRDSMSEYVELNKDAIKKKLEQL